MSGLCGWVGRRFTPEQSREILDLMAAALPPGASQSPRLLIGRGTAAALAQSAGGSAYEDEGMLTVIEGNAWFRDPAQTHSARDHGTIAKALAVVYKERGIDALDCLHGAFCVAMVDKASGSALLAIDRLGIRPLTYVLVNDCLIFASSARAIKIHPGVRTDIDHQGIFDYLYFHMVPAPMCIYKGLHRLLPGSYVTFARGKLATGNYWQIEYDEDRSISFEDRKQEFIALLDRSVRRHVGGSIGCFLSGGTDSSTVAGMVGRVTGKPASTYSIGFGAFGYDETAYARIAARYFGTDHHAYYVTPDDVAVAIPKIAATYDHPYGNASAVPTYYCARLARDDGVDTLLAGDGGDELFGGNPHYARQWQFSLYSDLPAVLRKGLIQPLLFGIPAGDQIWPVRKLQSYIRQASLPMPARLETYNFLARIGVDRIFHKHFLEQVDQGHPLKTLTEIYDGVHADGMLNKMLGLDLKITLADNDLPKVTRMCELAGLKTCFPLLDDDLVAFSACLPAELKLKRTRLRYFFKKALAGFLPQETLQKSKHGFGLPFGPWLVSYKILKDLVHDDLRDLAARRIVRSEFIRELMDTRLADHPGYYGTLVWVLVMLEEWFKRHID